MRSIRAPVWLNALFALLLTLHPEISAGFSQKAVARRRQTVAVLVQAQASPQEEPLAIAIDPESDYAQSLLSRRLKLTQTQREQVLQYCALILEWNQKINLVSRKECTPEVIFGRHILPCLSPNLLAPSIQPGDRVVDVGTGAGFPGIPLAILHPDAHFLLVDSVGKKLTAVQDMVQRLNLDNVQVLHSRAEDIPNEAGFDWCVGRSVASLPKFCAWMHHLLKPQTGKLLYIIGGDVPEADMADSDTSIHDLLTRESDLPLPDDITLLSEKRILIFPQKAVQVMASESGILSTPSKAQKNNNNSKKKPTTKSPKKNLPKGAWQKNRDDKTKKNVNDGFQRYSST